MKIVLALLLGFAPVLAASRGPSPSSQSAARGEAGPDARDREGLTALMRAALDGDVELVRRLLAGGADPNLRDPQGDTALHFAAGRDDPAVVRALVEAGAGVDVANDEGRTPLIVAAQSRAESVRLLLERGADVSHRDRLGLSALTVAEAAGRSEVAALLREAGGRRSNEERLDEAIRDGDEATVRRLLEEGVDANALDTEFYRTPLMTAVKERRLEILLRLLEAGADPTVEGTGIETSGENAILLAARERSPWALRVLIEARARPEDLDRALVAGCSQEAVVRVLLGAGARVGARGAGGTTPLMCAAAEGATEAVSLLLEAGADPAARSDDGMTARDLAEASSHGEVAAILERAESRP